MHKIKVFMLANAMSLAGFSQLITTDPAFPVTNLPVTITFNAALGNGGLAGYTGDVYAHTGVITENSALPSDWKYVKTDWGENTPETKMTRIGDDLYTLEIVPTVREYYGVPGDEDILQMAFVFRSGVQVGEQWLEGKTETGGDIFVTVTEPGLGITFLQPQNRPVLVGFNETVTIEVIANEATHIRLFVDGGVVAETSGNYLLETYTPVTYDPHLVKAVAENNDSIVSDSFYIHVRPVVNVEALPSGARDGINYISDESVVLSLLAPGKEFIYVIGDFNNWEITNSYYMNLTPDSLRFWLQIDGLMAGQEYIFQYFIDGAIRVGDPYSDKISDPWNDHYISELTYPGLIGYPAGKTTGIAAVLQTGQEPYQWEVNGFIPAKITDLVIYELLVRDFTTGHSFAGITDTLDYLASMGINALELMPVNEFEGNSSWGYNPSFYFAPDKYYGPKNDLKRLIDECHKRGIAVILDVVLNHSYNQAPLVQMYFDGTKPTAENPWYNVQHNFSNPDAHWGNDFNHESIYTQQFVDSVNSYWMSEYRFDGFRFDFTKGFSNTYHGDDDPWGSNYDADRIAILKRMADEIWKRNDDAIVIIEHLSENLEEKVLANYGFLLWGNSNYNYSEASMGYHDGGKSDFSSISYKKRTWSDPHLVGYMESHDEERIMFKNLNWGNSNGYSYDITDPSIALARIRLISTFFYTVPGPKMLWQFGELGYDYSIDYNGRLGEKPVRWDYLDDWRRSYNYDFISALISLRKVYDVFETRDFELNVADEMKRIKLTGDDMNVLVIGNFNVVPAEINPIFHHTGAWYDYFNGTTLDVDDVNMPLLLLAGEYRLFTDVELETPDIGTSVDPGHEGIKNNLSATIIPNPFSSDAQLHLELLQADRVQITIFNDTGTMVMMFEEMDIAAGRHTINLNAHSLKAGIYLCVIHSGTDQDTIKFIKQK